ncbi:uncharacterized protein P174DRAFT_432873 [Aspergillus novofumigatus IBT 16806]|uniref:Uncharacterized protein n=1 Tax=Aspergillus novofumigatus (strain IBT 16806) TaxID=1392255 RepID=A0A2I1C1A9_ASPN1|nr:uncharacterized protein P174DRAFT_432873 [Aspergillus novofumigatus IBT 16806]PKX91420.1 hypothetical protein P174DRAFT_432873 [Aspergillus novofumigatus IBT 16806]
MSAQELADNSLIDTWALVRNLFSREEYHLQQIARLERSLANAGHRNHQDRTAYNSLHQQYESLYQAYTDLQAEHERLKQELATLQRQCCHKQDHSPNVESAQAGA